MQSIESAQTVVFLPQYILFLGFPCYTFLLRSRFLSDGIFGGPCNVCIRVMIQLPYMTSEQKGGQGTPQICGHTICIGFCAVGPDRWRLYIQCGWGGWPTGNGKKLSSSQAQLGLATCLAVTYFLFISGATSAPSALY